MAAAKRDGGFTLIELLVVLGIGAILLASVQMVGANRTVGLNVVAAQVASGIRSARESAIAFGQPVSLLIARDGGAYQFSTARAGVQLPRGVRVAFHGSTGLNRAGLSDQLTFFVDGTSTGGRVIVRNATAVLSLVVEPLSGSVRLEATP